MNLNNIIFYDNYPTLDLHGYDRDSARVMILDFIKDNKKMKNPIIVIVHGIGSGIIRTTTQQILKKHKDVLDYKSIYFNRGCTLVLLKIEE